MEAGIQTVFKRYETKYFVSDGQLDTLRADLGRYMKEDSFGTYPICNLYFDTADYALIRSSIEKPQYKEKLRLRSYGVPKAADSVFVELKKKYDGVVYKRRVTMTQGEAMPWLLKGKSPGDESQIMREIQWFLDFYHPVPKAFIAYDRTALSGLENSALRITFDRNIRWRSTSLDLSQGDWGAPLLPPGKTLMEIKIPGASPLWLSRLLSELQIYPTTFSKYGTCYKQHLIHDFLKKGVFLCA